VTGHGFLEIRDPFQEGFATQQNRGPIWQKNRPHSQSRICSEEYGCQKRSINPGTHKWKRRCIELPAESFPRPPNPPGVSRLSLRTGISASIRARGQAKGRAGSKTEVTASNLNYNLLITELRKTEICISLKFTHCLQVQVGFKSEVQFVLLWCAFNLNSPQLSAKYHGFQKCTPQNYR
jgi:hypothetical protein